MRASSRLTYANVMATTAVIIALVGGAYVAYALERNSVESQHIKDHEVKTRDLARGATIANARAVDGSSIKQVSWEAPNNTPFAGQKLFSIHGLTVHAFCSDGEDKVYLRARTAANNSILGIGALNAKTYGGDEGDAIMFPGIDNDFDSGPGEEAYVELDDTATVMSYGNGGDSKPVVTATFLANQWVGGGGECKVVGTVVHG
jgi:hypothetical protein